MSSMRCTIREENKIKRENKKGTREIQTHFQFLYFLLYDPMKLETLSTETRKWTTDCGDETDCAELDH